MLDPSPFPVRDIWRLDTRRLGRTVTVFHEVDSTNSRAADCDREGEAFLADCQSAGRGQHGRSWLAPPRSSVLLSLLVHPPPHLARPALLTAWAAVSVCAVVHEITAVDACIKWPNDILVGGKKVCGILIEMDARGRKKAVVGMGLNVTQSREDFHNANLPDATSLALLGGVRDTDEVARTLIRRLDDEYDLLLSQPAAIESRWSERLGLVGEEVLAECPGGNLRGRLVEVTFDGLTLERPDGCRLVLAPETILHLRQP
jgi:BirA family biotin operon repressor/biotin-[acetyl-CoA-carboxylase] ligase